MILRATPAGHTKDVVDLAAAANKQGVLASLSKDGNLRLWDAPAEQCLASYTTEANCLVRSPSMLLSQLHGL